MVPDSTGSLAAIRRSRWPRVLLLLLLLPQAAATIWISTRPDQIQFAHVDEQGTRVTTATEYSWDSRCWQTRVLFLDRGETRYLKPWIMEPGYFARSGNRAYFDEQGGKRDIVLVDPNRFTELARYRVEDPTGNGITTSPAIRMYSVSPQYAACLDQHRRDVALVNLSSNSFQRFWVPAPLNYGWVPRLLATSERLLLLEVGPPIPGQGNRCQLLDIGNGARQVVGSWEANANSVVFERDGELFSFTLDGSSVERRSARTGELISTQSLVGKVRGSPPFQWSDVGLAAPVISSPNELTWYDPQQETVVAVTGRDTRGDQVPFAWRIVAQRELIEAARDGLSGISVRNRRTQQILSRCNLPQPIVAAAFTSDAKQLIAVHPDDSVRLINVLTGDTERIYRSQTAVLPVLLVLVGSFVWWSLAWVRQSCYLGTAPAWDVAVINGCLMSGLVTRLLLFGSQQDPTRPVLQCAQALCASWFCLAALWLVFGRARWSVRMLGPLLALAGTLILVQLVFRGDTLRVWQLLLWRSVVGSCGIIVFVAAMLFLARRWGWSLMLPLSTSQEIPAPANSPRQVPLRDLFWMITIIAVLFSAGRFVGPHLFDLPTATMIAIIAVTASCSGTAGIWAALGASTGWRRCIGLLSMIVVNSGVLPLVLPRFRDPDLWWESLCLQAWIGGFTCASLLAFRRRGWRFREVGSSPPGQLV